MNDNANFLKAYLSVIFEQEDTSVWDGVTKDSMIKVDKKGARRTFARYVKGSYGDEGASLEEKLRNATSIRDFRDYFEDFLDYLDENFNGVSIPKPLDKAPDKKPEEPPKAPETPPPRKNDEDADDIELVD